MVGEEGVKELQSMLYVNSLDIATVVTRLSLIVSTLTTSLQWSKLTFDQLLKIIDVDAVRELDNQAILRVHFQKEAHLSNVTEFKEWGKSW